MNNSWMYKSLTAFLVLMGSSAMTMAQGNATANANENLLYGVLVAFGILFLVIILVLNSVIKGLATNNKLWKPKNGNGGSVAGAILAILMVLSSGSAFAVDPDATVIGVFSQYSSTFWLLVLFDVFLAVIIIVQLSVFRKLIESLREKDVVVEVDVVEEHVARPQESRWMKKVMKMLTRSVPVEKEEEIMTDHEYDGIRELDNVLPPWWVAMFYASIVFAFVYLVHYHVLGTGDLQIEEYHNSIEEANAEITAYMALAKAQVDENTVTRVTDASRLNSGKDIYMTHCVTCHSEQGEGGVGPNFTDEYWIHGGSISDLFATIKYGVPSKGMISWRAQLSPTQMQDVASYILTFQGTDPPNQKEPQGELYVPEDADEPKKPDEPVDPGEIAPVDSTDATSNEEL